jgi:hypothetical protein
MMAFSKNGLSITFAFTKPSPTTTVIMATASNSTGTPISNFVLQAAVPKVRMRHFLSLARDANLGDPQYISLAVDSPSGSVLQPNGANQITQQLKLENSLQGQVRYPFYPSFLPLLTSLLPSLQKGIMLRLKVDYTQNGANVTESTSLTTFPAGL